MIEDSDEAPYPLLENSYQLCDGPNRDQDSYQGGMYYLYSGSLLYVETDELAGDKTLSDGIRGNPEFGLYMLWNIVILLYTAIYTDMQLRFCN